MAREFAKTNLTIWQDPEWRALPWPAQHVYKMFWEHPSLSYCGVADWRPQKMIGWGAGWERDHMDLLTDCLRARHFLVVDEDTEECLVRSWIRFDGVVRQPRLAVSLAKAFAEVGSNTIRGVIVNELAKLREREPDAQGWTKDPVLDLLDLPQIEAKSLPTPTDPFATGFGITFGSVSPSVSEAFGRNATSGLGSVSDPPTTATSTSTSQHQPATRKRAARRLPDDFAPNDDHVAIAAGLGVDLDHEFAKFCDYWRSEGKTKADWNATLRNWIRTAAEDRRGKPRPTPVGGSFPVNGTDAEKDAWVKAQPLPADGAYYGGSAR